MSLLILNSETENFTQTRWKFDIFILSFIFYIVELDRHIEYIVIYISSAILFLSHISGNVHKVCNELWRVVVSNEL